jgi:hypothetical protein
MTTTTPAPYQQLCQELLLCKFSEEEIEQVLRKYIPSLSSVTDPDACALVWGCPEDIEHVLECMDIDDYDEEDYDHIMDGWEEAMNERSMEYLRYVVEGYEDWTKQGKREGR